MSNKEIIREVEEEIEEILQALLDDYGIRTWDIRIVSNKFNREDPQVAITPDSRKEIV